ncbi:sulfotransferase family protein [Geminicoccus roseus]|uniref:sulfotransferase family protein n=1 Tax=Geminicoccus roseus TaxID=404900 RepID=UPI00048A4278|nr:sulfotransferase family protein [Geminicoccus roseus]
MSLKIIGSGFSRTGTLQVKMALEQLGFGPCHHMTELLGDPKQLRCWQALAAGEDADWDQVFDGYTAQIDWPGAAAWYELSMAFPRAKVIHTERPAEEWWNSFRATTGKLLAVHPTIPMSQHGRRVMAMLEQWIVEPLFGGDPLDRERAITAYQRNNQRVRDLVRADRLLVLSPGDGWDPLCRFLQVPPPGTPFPRSHARAEFWAPYGGEPALAG